MRNTWGTFRVLRFTFCVLVGSVLKLGRLGEVQTEERETSYSERQTQNAKRETFFQGTASPRTAPATWKVARAINLPERSMISTRFTFTAGLIEYGNATTA
jgi:hypothetical protein